METRIYHGNITAENLAKALSTRFTQGDMSARAVRSGQQIIVQIGTRQYRKSGGQTALGVVLQQLDDGVAIKIGKQDWLGIAASLGISALSLRRSPLNIINRLDDIAQDIQNLNLDDRVWDVIDEVAATMGASQELSKRLKRMVCEYCDTANPVGEPRCIACGAPLGDVQPRTCPTCGFVAAPKDKICTNCNQPLP